MPTVFDVLVQRGAELHPERLEKLNRELESAFRAVERFGLLIAGLAKAIEPQIAELAKAIEPHMPAIERGLRNFSEPLPVAPSPVHHCCRVITSPPHGSLEGDR